HLSLLRRQVSEEVRVVLVSQRGELRNESAPGASERHALNAPIVRIERSGDQALRDQPVDDLGYGTLRHPERVDERTRGGWTGGEQPAEGNPLRHGQPLCLDEPTERARDVIRDESQPKADVALEIADRRVGLRRRLASRAHGPDDGFPGNHCQARSGFTARSTRTTRSRRLTSRGPAPATCAANVLLDRKARQSGAGRSPSPRTLARTRATTRTRLTMPSCGFFRQPGSNTHDLIHGLEAARLRPGHPHTDSLSTEPSRCRPKS